MEVGTVGGQKVWRRTAAPADAVVAEAARSLGWPGVALPEMTVLGGRVHPLVALDLDVHRARLTAEESPQLDDDVLTIWEWPESAKRAPRPALQLCGMVVRTTRGWSSGLTEATRWRGFGPSAVLGVTGDQPGELVRLEAALDGVGLVTVDPTAPVDPDPTQDCALTSLLPAEAGRRAPARRRIADRWLEELLYRRALEQGLYAALKDPHRAG